MKLKILLSTTSYQDTPGPHHGLLQTLEAEVISMRGPLSEKELLDVVGDFDAFLCGDDQITREVLNQSLPRLKVISKYGIGLDKIDVAACTELGIPVTFCPGVNHTTVAEQVFLLLLACMRSFPLHYQAVREGKWLRQTGRELRGKRLGVVGLGRIGREVVKRALAFEMEVFGYGASYWPAEFAEKHSLKRADSLEQLFADCDILSLNTRLTDQSRYLIREETIRQMRDGVVIVNCGRGELIRVSDVLNGLVSGKIGAYAADVLDQEPPPADHPLLSAPNCIITPHIGSRTFESVERQAMMATENLILALQGKPPLAQFN
jgi:D-3-phosphoglycerate dehydrogenase